MKNLMIIVFLIAGNFAGGLMAQLTETQMREKMKVFESWPGRWTGEGSMQMGPGEPKKSSVVEHIEAKLGGMIYVVEGKGTVRDPATQRETTVHHAFAVLSFDQVSGEYKFMTYLHDGRATPAWFRVLGDDRFQWGFDSPRGKIRYHITFKDQKWHETGEFSADGTNWSQFFEMNLTKE